MRYLAILSGIFSFLCFSLIWSSADPVIGLLAVVALLCALVEGFAPPVSPFLNIFMRLFTLEMIGFGLLVLAQMNGFWPDAWHMFRMPGSVPLSVGIFSLLIWAASHLSIIRMITNVADSYFKTDDVGHVHFHIIPPFHALERRVAQGMIISLVIINQAQVAISVRLSFFNRDWFNAIQNKDEAVFWGLLLAVFMPWAFIYVASAITEYVIKSMLVIRWRRWLTAHYVQRWLDGSAHYVMNVVLPHTQDLQPDNPDQRIAEDVNAFIDGGGTTRYGLYSYSVLLISTLSSAVSFSIILWDLSENFPLPGTEILIPGFLFWVALIYAFVGTFITHQIGRVLVPLFFEQQKCEAGFRFSLARVREYGEQVALLKGENREQSIVMHRFNAIIRNYLLIIGRQKILIAFVAFYDQISSVIPYLLTAPFYFLGKIQLGVMTQTAGAFGRVQDSLNFFVTYYASLAGFRSVLERLRTFEASIDHVGDLAAAVTHIQYRDRGPKDQGVEQERGLEISNLSLFLPGGRSLSTIPHLLIRPLEHTLITGPSGCGKSTLFRALAGIWPYGQGEIRGENLKELMLLPQRPYIPLGALEPALTYPSVHSPYSHEEVLEVMDLVGLGHLQPFYHDAENWSMRLSGGEQQKLSFARALLAKPKWLCLDEFTSALDEENQSRLYELLKSHLPETTYISIGHRSTLSAFHVRSLEMQANESGTFKLVEAA